MLGSLILPLLPLGLGACLGPSAELLESPVAKPRAGGAALGPSPEELLGQLWGTPGAKLRQTPWAIAQFASPVFLLFLSLSLYFANFREVPGVSGDAWEVPGFPGNFGNLKKWSPQGPSPGSALGPSFEELLGQLWGIPGARHRQTPWADAQPFFCCFSLCLCLSANFRGVPEISGDARGFPGSTRNVWECPGISGNSRDFFREFRKPIFGDPGHPTSQKTCERTCFLRTQSTRGARTPMKTKDFFGSPWAPEELEHL